MFSFHNDLHVTFFLLCLSPFCDTFTCICIYPLSTDSIENEHADWYYKFELFLYEINGYNSSIHILFETESYIILYTPYDGEK